MAASAAHEKLEALVSNKKYEGGVSDAEACINEKDRQLTKHHADEMERHESLEKQVVRISDGLHVQALQVSRLDETITQRLLNLEQRAEDEVYEARVARQSLMAKMQFESEKAAGEAYARMLEDRKSVQCLTAYKKDVQAEVCNLVTHFSQARDMRIEGGRKVAGSVSAKFEEITTALSAEKHIREESTSTLLGLLGQMGQRVESTLVTCREERDEMVLRFISALENASGVLEDSQRTSANMCNDVMEDTVAAKDMASSARRRTRCTMVNIK